jgi:hypothetical protein
MGGGHPQGFGLASAVNGGRPHCYGSGSAVDGGRPHCCGSGSAVDGGRPHCYGRRSAVDGGRPQRCGRGSAVDGRSPQRYGSGLPMDGGRPQQCGRPPSTAEANSLVSSLKLIGLEPLRVVVHGDTHQSVGDVIPEGPLCLLRCRGFGIAWNVSSYKITVPEAPLASPFSARTIRSLPCMSRRIVILV